MTESISSSSLLYRTTQKLMKDENDRMVKQRDPCLHVCVCVIIIIIIIINERYSNIIVNKLT